MNAYRNIREYNSYHSTAKLATLCILINIVLKKDLNSGKQTIEFISFTFFVNQRIESQRYITMS